MSPKKKIGGQGNGDLQDETGLRQRAEAQVGQNLPPNSPSQKMEVDAQRLVHELQVHQIELEMQNEELRQARDEVKAGLDRYTDLYELAPLGYFTFNQEGSIQQVNLNGARLLGIERSKLVGRRFDVFVASRDLPIFQGFLKNVFKNGAKETCEIALNHAEDGRPGYRPEEDASIFSSEPAPRWVLIEAVAADDQKSCLAVIVDLSERKLAEEKIANLARFSEQNPDPILRITRSGILLYANPSSQCLLEELNLQTGKVVPKILLNLVDEVLASHLNQTIEIRCGETVYSLRIVPFSDIGYVNVYGQDVTERANNALALQKARDELESMVQARTQELQLTNQWLQSEREQLLALSRVERSQRQFAESLAQATAALSSSLNLNDVLDQILDQLEKVIPFDAALISLFDQDHTQVARSRGFERWPGIIESLQTRVPAEKLALVKEMLSLNSPLVVMNSEDEPGFRSMPGLEWVRVSISIPLQTRENVIGSFNLFYEQDRNFTKEHIERLSAFASQASIAIQNARLFQALESSLNQEHDLHTRLIQIEKMALLGRMIASVSHELNNPLQTIKNCLFLSRQDTHPDSPVQEYLDMAISETLRIHDLVNQLRQLYRPQGETITKSHSLLKIIDEVHSLLRPHLDNMKVIWKQKPTTEEIQVLCHPDQIKQVFINIGMNGIEAMQPEGGTLTVKLNIEDKLRRVGVVFHDNGPGIPDEILKNLFEPFVTTKPSGLGLGLSICYEIIQRHQGEITVETHMDQGTTFTIWFPRLVDHPAA